MSFSINEIRSHMNKGIVKPSRFKVFFSLPSKIDLRNIDYDINSELLTLSAETISIPGRNITTSEGRIYNIMRKHPYAIEYDDLNISFICTGKMEVRKIFENWQNLIIDPVTYKIEYYNNFVSDLKIIQYNESEEVINRYRIENAYPISIAEQSLDWNETDSYLKLNVIFSYKSWTNI